MQLTEFSFQASQPFRMIEREAKETAESVFVLDGNSQSRFANLSSALSFNKDRHNFQYNHEFGGEHTFYASRFHAFTVTYGLSFLQGLFEAGDDRSMGQLADHVHHKKTFVASSEALSSDGRVKDVIASIRQCPFSGVTRYLFLESKMMELFVLQMQQAEALSEKRKAGGWSAIDREKLYAVRDYVENAYLETFSLKDLTYKFNLNEFKLKKGYKQFFQTTVFGHVYQLRMQKAKSLLQQKAMTVSEAAFFIGYDNVSSFCAEFKKRFGYTPGRASMISWT
jgi:AraC-like DNA-binding protein